MLIRDNVAPDLPSFQVHVKYIVAAYLEKKLEKKFSYSLLAIFVNLGDIHLMKIFTATR